MEREKYTDAVKRANCVLDLKRRIVGVRFIFSKEDFEQANAETPKGKMPYCKMINRAMDGNGMKVDFDNFGCFAAARVLGIVDMDDWYVSGHYYGRCGLYQDMPTAKEVTDSISNCGHKAYGLEIMPLEEFEEEPHIVIIATNTFNAMRFVQGHAYKYGTHRGYKFMANQAMCAECTAHPYQTNDINISLLCVGTRKSGFNEDELGIGIPLTKFVDMVDGLCKTVTPAEPNRTKKIIEEKLNASGISDVEIIYNKNYGDGMHKHDFAYFKKREE